MAETPSLFDRLAVAETPPVAAEPVTVVMDDGLSPTPLDGQPRTARRLLGWVQLAACLTLIRAEANGFFR